MKKIVFFLFVISSFLLGDNQNSLIEEMIITTSHITVELTTISTIQNDYNRKNPPIDRGKYQKRYYSSLEFIKKNGCNISYDIAKGDGEYLETLANILEITDKDKIYYKLSLQKEFNQIYDKDCNHINPNNVNEKIYALIL